MFNYYNPLVFNLNLLSTISISSRNVLCLSLIDVDYTSLIKLQVCSNCHDKVLYLFCGSLISLQSYHLVLITFN